MSRRGATRDSMDALELFLDALSNAFGGILFIALLVCVKLQFSKALPLVDPQEVERLGSVRDELNNDVENLLEEHRNLTRQINSMPKTDNLRVARYRSLVEEREKQRQRSMNRQMEERELETELAKLKRQQAASANRDSRLEREMRRARNKLEDAERKDALIVRLPRAHDTESEPVPVLLGGGRLRFVLEYDKDGIPQKLNERDVEMRNGIVTPKPDRGLVIGASEDSRLAFEEQMARFDPSSRYLDIFVWDDSFSSFELIREWLGRGGFEHNVSLLKQGDAIVVGRSGKKQVQ